MSTSLLEQVKQGLPSDLRAIYFDEDAHSGIHLAVMREPYLTLLLEGTKTIESRFSINRVDPFDRVAEGDLVLLKAGMVVAAFVVDAVSFLEVQPEDLLDVRSEFNDRIRADPEFWEAKQEARFVSLMQVSHVRMVDRFRVDKRDMRGWVVLRAPQSDLPTLW